MWDVCPHGVQDADGCGDCYAATSRTPEPGGRERDVRVVFRASSPLPSGFVEDAARSNPSVAIVGPKDTRTILEPSTPNVYELHAIIPARVEVSEVAAVVGFLRAQRATADAVILTAAVADPWHSDIEILDWPQPESGR